MFPTSNFCFFFRPFPPARTRLAFGPQIIGGFKAACFERAIGVFGEPLITKSVHFRAVGIFDVLRSACSSEAIKAFSLDKTCFTCFWNTTSF
jgi:hypothetical protein